MRSVVLLAFEDSIDSFEKIFGRLAYILGKLFALLQERQALFRDLVEYVLFLKHLCDDSDSSEALITQGIVAFGIQNTWCDDGREIQKVHLASRRVAACAMREERHPLEECEEHLHGTSVTLGHDDADKVE